MFNQRVRSDYGVRVHRKQTIIAVTAAVIILIVIFSGTIVFIGLRNKLGNERKELEQLWLEGSYEKVFEISRGRLEKKPMDFFLLTTNGFSAYQLAMAQINDYDIKTHLDNCIWALRKALLCKEGPGDTRIPYVLGKAYYHKGSGYEDLTIQFLEAARERNYQASDLPEYLGLAYAAIHDYRNSVAAFSQALSPVPEEAAGEEGDGADSPDASPIPSGKAPADLLLLAIARSYIALEDQASANMAKAYLVQCVETSRDSSIKITARLLLGDLFRKSGDVTQAEAQYLKILEENGENAEAHVQLGELYAAGGDSIRARAQWRTAVRIDPANRVARQRLNMN